MNERNIMIKISYDGTNYYGWQKQPNELTIQEVLENSLYKILGHKINIIGSGRTDSGVHALEQTANFKTNSKIDAGKIKYALNANLPKDIRVNESAEADINFHSRYNAKGKTYIYKILNSQINDPFLNKYSYFIPYHIDLELMQQSLEYLIGTYDFKAFMSTNSSVKNTIRTIYDLKINKDNKLIIVQATGSGFLYNMVRIIAGTLIEIGAGRRDKECFLEALKTQNRNILGHTAKPEGLFLKEVYYDEKNILKSIKNT